MNGIHVCFFVFCTKFCVAKIVKQDFFGVGITEKQTAFRDRDILNPNPVVNNRCTLHYFMALI